jgi:hypothetical protein
MPDNVPGEPSSIPSGLKYALSERMERAVIGMVGSILTAA